MRVVIFSPTDSYSPDSLPALLQTDEVTVVRWDGAGVTDAPNRLSVRQGSGAAKIVAAAAGNVLARTLVRATPLDTGARFWRATRSDARIREVVRRADLIVSPERDGGFAAWSWRRLAARKGREIVAVAGYPAARTAIEQGR